MALIPGRANLGQAAVDVQRSPIPTASNAIAQGAQDLAGGINALADEGMRAQMEMKQRAEEADRLKTAASLSELDNGMASIRQRVQADLAGGKIASREEAQKRFEDESLALNLSTMEKVPEALRDLAKTKGNEILSKEYTGLGTFLDTHATSESRGNLNTLKDGLGTQGLGSERALAFSKEQFKTAMVANEHALRYTPEESARILADFNGNATYNHFAFQMDSKPDDIKYIRDIKKRVSDNKQLTDLDEAKRIQLLNHASNLENQWEVEQRRIRDKAEAALITRASSFREFLLGGGDPAKMPDADRKDLGALLGSEKHGKSMRGALDVNQKVRVLNTLPISQQQAAIDAYRQNHQDTGDVDSFNQQSAVLASLDKSHQANTTAYKADPLAYTITKTMGEKMTPIDLTNPASISARKKQVAEASVINGKPLPPLSAPEIKLIAEGIKNLSPSQKTEAQAKLHETFGTQNVALMAPALAATTSPSFVAATMRAANTTSDGRNVGMLMNVGRSLIEEGKIKIPAADKLRIDFASRTGLTGVALDAALAGAMDIYATLAKEDGILEPASGRPDNALWSRAINLTTGNVYEINGEHVIAPHYGMSQAVFEDKLHATTPADVVKMAGGKRIFAGGREVSPEEVAALLYRAPLVNGVGPQLYVRAGTGLLTTEDGAPLSITVDNTPAKKTPFRMNTSVMMPGM